MKKNVFISHSSTDKLIADSICHKLEENAYRCWIAPRDIQTTDWAGSIMDGIHHSEIFIVIISHNSILSPEVLKEVTEATRICNYILPFKVDDDLLSPALKYHLGPCHWLDAVTPPLEQRLNELLDRLNHLSDEDAVYMNKERKKLMDKIVHPSCNLLGREAEINWLEEHFSQGDRILFLQGMGGIGKSEIAKKYAEQFAAEYDTIIFASYTSTILDLVCSDDITIEHLTRLNDETQELWFRKKLDSLRLLASERVLIIIDNFDTYEDEHFSELMAIPCRFLITTRMEHDGFSTLPIGSLSDITKVRELFSANYGKSFNKDDYKIIDEILELVDYHTMTVELIAKQMKASFLKPEKMLDRLKTTGVNTHLKEKVKKSGDTDKLTSFDFIRQLFKFSDLSEEETHLLEVMSLVPVSGIEIHLLQDILDLDSFDPINNLVSKSLLKLNEEAETIALHPVVADVVRSELAPDQTSCYDYIDGLRNQLRDVWWFTLEERNRLYPYLAALLRYFPLPTKELFTDYCSFINIPWICGDFEQSIQTGHHVYEFAQKEYGADSQKTALCALYLAGAYHNKGDNQASEPWYKKSLEIFEHSETQISEYQAQCCFKVGRCARWRKDFSEAEYYYSKAEHAYNSLIQRGITARNENYPEMYLDFLIEKEQLCMDKGMFADALGLCKANFDILIDNWGDENASIYYILTDMGICYNNLKQYDTAEDYLNRALDATLKYHGLASVATILVKEAMIENYQSWQKNETAQAILEELILDLEKYFGPNNPQTLRIKAKWKIS